MEQENLSLAQSVPGTPLQQISQDRLNQLRMPQSPSIPAYLNENESTSRRGSDIGVAADVKSKIAFFSNNQSGNIITNSFAIAGSPTRSPIKSSATSPLKSHSRANSSISIPSNAAELTTLVQTLQVQLEQSRNRERLVAERVESMMEQLQNAHTRARQEQQYNDKEIKSMKKQVHKAELALIKCQTELEEARKEQEGFKVRAEHERQAKEKSRQEAFERARTLASNIEELEVVKRERDLLLSENETLKSVENIIQMQLSQAPVKDMRDSGVQVEMATIRENVKGKSKERQPNFVCSKCNEPDIGMPESAGLEAVQEMQEELDWVKSQLKREQELVHFMNMQCQFKSCPCRMAERAGVRFVHDHAYDQRQQEIVRSQGIKRKAEDDLPLPQYVTLRERFEQKSREREEARSGQQTPVTAPATQLQQDLDKEIRGEVTDEADEADEDPTLRAMPISDSSNVSNTAGVIPLEEAAQIPLPSPSSNDLDATALLEDMTQVMVEPEPAATAKHFAFSTSTSSRRPIEVDTPPLRQSHSALSVSATDDLFDIAPPKHLPPRPSTVMGVRTVCSPIRMVPASPEHRTSLTPNTSPPRYRTMQVPLKDSPLKNTVTQRRSQSRPRGQSRARSPTPGRYVVDTNSPSADTYFPVTPKQKNERPTRNPEQQTQSHSQLHALHSQSQTETTTTKVPVRGLDEDDVFSPEKSQSCHHDAHTQPLDTFSRGRQPLLENDPIASHSQSTMLPGTPITREAALAQIRARRDRARSVAMRKQADDENAGRTKTPKSAARRGVMLNREAMGRDISNLSQASAPARFGAGF